MTDYTPLLTRLRAATVPEQSDLIVALAELIAGDDEPFVRRIKYLCVYNAFESATIAITGRALPGWEWSIASGSKHHEIRPYATVQEQFADAPEIENARFLNDAWPNTSADAWCGEYQPAPPAAATERKR
jgi:hypothetical protein